MSIAPRPPATRLASLCLLMAALALAACSTTNSLRAPSTLLGRPADGIGALGTAGADSEVLLVREAGRLLEGGGELLEAPALAVESLLPGTPATPADAGGKLVLGVGRTLTGLVNLPFFAFTGWSGHWAERDGPNAAYVVEHGLRDWDVSGTIRVP